MHGVKLSSWPGLPTAANSCGDSCYLLWERFASAWWLGGLRGAERVLERCRGGGVFQHRVGSRRVPCKRCRRLHLNNEEGHFLLFFRLPLRFPDAFHAGLWICSLLVWLNNCMGGQGTEAETSPSSDKSNVLS